MFSTPSLTVHWRAEEIPEAGLPPMAIATDPAGAPPAASRTVANVEVRPRELQVFVGGVRAAMTVREFEIFHVLFENHNRVVQRSTLYEAVWGARMPRRDRSVDVFIRKVRAKLDTAEPSYRFIHTHYGIGYRFAPEPASAQQPG